MIEKIMSGIKHKKHNKISFKTSDKLIMLWASEIRGVLKQHLETKQSKKE